jgi:N-acetylglutamate synthase
VNDGCKKVNMELLMKIRSMDMRDYEGVYQLWIRTPGMGLNAIDDSKDGIKKYLERNPTSCFIATENEAVIGVILSGHDGRRGFIHHTAVDESRRKTGIGRKLVEKALEALKNEGIIKVGFVVFKKNVRGKFFWERLGFTVREDILYMNKAITDRDIERIDT